MFLELVILLWDVIFMVVFYYLLFCFVNVYREIYFIIGMFKWYLNILYGFVNVFRVCVVV